jgi:nascent polypeptide-associated complex subunit alpha
MFPKMNPSQMAGMMKKLGIQNEEINAKKVTIETTDGKIVFDNPKVMCVKMQGTRSYQISGEERTESTEKFSEEDITLVMEKTGKTKEEVEKVLEKTEGDIAEAITQLS